MSDKDVECGVGDKMELTPILSNSSGHNSVSNNSSNSESSKNTLNNNRRGLTARQFYSRILKINKGKLKIILNNDIE